MIKLPYLTEEAISHFIKQALAEDIGEGDHSSLSSIAEQKEGRAELRIKASGILAGVELANRIFRTYDSHLVVDVLLSDGASVEPGQIALTVEGRVRSILSTERLVLNCMQRMSGIATYTRKLCKLIEGTGAQLMDTRKTTPNFRLPEKWAVAIGGGLNHRFALYDMIMLKDNHVDMAGGVGEAITRARQYLEKTGKKLLIEIETRNLDEVHQALQAGGVDVIMLDNMSTEDMKRAVQAIAGIFKTEASGGITEDNLRAVALCGVDYISVGALTHSVRSLDMSLKVVK
ncbi:MAG: carboxylating nicotinate-nucleotide diphosphorylase [Cyclobacteriaceae bacterium]